MADKKLDIIINPEPIQTNNATWMAVCFKSAEFSGINASIFNVEKTKPIKMKKRPKANIKIHIEPVKLLSPNLSDLNFAKAVIKTDEKIMGDMPVRIAGMDNILK